MLRKFLPFVIIVFIASIVIILIFWAVLPDSFRKNESDDYLFFYEPVARNILDGRGIKNTDGTVANLYPPAYPIILATLFWICKEANLQEDRILSAFILLCMAFSSVMLFLIVALNFGIKYGLITSFIWMTYPSALWIAKQPNSEIPFMPVLYACIYLFWYSLQRHRTWLIYLGLGILIGVSMLIRPIGIGIGIIFTMILLLIKRDGKVKFRLFWGTMVLSGNLISIFPWIMWNYTNSGQTILLSKGGVASIVDGLTYAVNQDYRYRHKVPKDVEVLMEDILDYGMWDKKVGDIAVLLAREMHNRPIAVLKLFGLKAIRSWYGTDSGRFENLILLIQIGYLVLVSYASIVAWERGGIFRDFVILIWGVVIYFWGMTILVNSMVRYMLPGMGLLFTLIPIGVIPGRRYLAQNYG